MKSFEHKCTTFEHFCIKKTFVSMLIIIYRYSLHKFFNLL